MSEISYAEGQSGWRELTVPILEDFGRVDTYTTEEDFQESIEKVVMSDVVVFGDELQWTNPKPNMSEMPQAVEEGGPEEAINRCYNLLREREGDDLVTPAIFYSTRGNPATKGELVGPEESWEYIDRREDDFQENFRHTLEERLR